MPPKVIANAARGFESLPLRKTKRSEPRRGRSQPSPFAWVGYQSYSRSKGSTTDVEFEPIIDYFLVDATSIGADAFFGYSRGTGLSVTRAWRSHPLDSAILIKLSRDAR